MTKLTEKTFPTLDSLPPKNHLYWKTGQHRLLYKSPIFDIVSVERTNNLGKAYQFVQVDAKQWVNIVPVFTGTDGIKRFVLERQYRHGTGETSIEFPGGIVEQDEDPLEAAKRELLEETGLVAGSLKLIANVSPNSAIMNNRLFIFEANNLENSGKFDWDECEEIDVFSMPEAEVLHSIGYGEFDNGIMQICAYSYIKERNFKL